MQLPILISITYIPDLITTVIGGIMVDKYGTNITSIICISCVLAGAVVFAFSINFAMLLAGRFLFGIGYHSYEVVNDTQLSRWFFRTSEKKKSPSLAFSYSFAFAAGHLGQLIAVNGVTVVAQDNLKLAYIITMAGVALGWVFNVICIIQDKLTSKILDAEEEEDATPSQIVRQSEFPLKAFRYFPIHYWLLAGIIFFGNANLWTFLVYSVDILVESYGYSLADAGHIQSVVYFGSFIICPITGWYIGLYGRYLFFLFIGSISLLIGYTIFTFVPQLTPIVPLCFVSVAFSFVPSTLWSSIPIVVHEEHEGVAFGTVTTINSVGLLVLPFAISYLHDHFDNYYYVCLLLMCCTAVSIVLVVCLYLAERFNKPMLMNDPNPVATHLINTTGSFRKPGKKSTRKYAVN